MSKYYSKRPEHYKKRNKDRYYKNKAMGVCVHCLKQPIDYSRSIVSCTKCLDQKVRGDRERRGLRRANNVCIDCGAPIEPWLLEDGLHTCQHHYDTRNMRNNVSNING